MNRCQFSISEPPWYIYNNQCKRKAVIEIKAKNSEKTYHFCKQHGQKIKDGHRPAFVFPLTEFVKP